MMARSSEQQHTSRHGAKDGVEAADGRAVLVVVCLGVAHLVELRLGERGRMGSEYERRKWTIVANWCACACVCMYVCVYVCVYMCVYVCVRVCV